ncbi:hypothetical protein SAMN02745753_01839 [Marinomonas polaris DSM 16579]|uniref:Uncharacterized protein n=2 Tax=Marinomonas TaxID=28253 RepID=A0A1M5B6B2_9GAMM|nr:hypothetical protein SAMN02745753_01839 [Marinomonas polaris DSM 16579]
MKKHQYSENSGSGFLLSTSTPTKLVGKYIEKVILKNVVEDPFGEIFEVESINYYTCQFNWNSESSFMYISEPPRSLRKFSNKLHSLTGLGLVLSELNVAPERWLGLIEEEAEKVKILQISAYGIRASLNSTAKIVVSGKTDVREAFAELVSDKRYLTDSIKFEAEFEGMTVKGELTKSGSCKLTSPNLSFVLEKLRGSLEKSTTHYY